MVKGSAEDVRSPLAVKVGKNLKRLRELADLTQADLHVLTSVGLSHISRIERGVGNPTLDMMEALAIGLKCEIRDLLQDPPAEA
ncbi:helix-turn-helix domain-containing protein [Novosphingobium terrae]|uniref:helix-turn-helix domain-containing protein n=1 Tax=Novosphingobium terrae TaxID=2726189 RepID=UPI001980D001|nr:helix-turn-helix transcriptional regulator [Novosphingobium terrae]